MDSAVQHSMQQSVQVCGFTAGLVQNNWLITQLINRTVNGTRLSQVSVLIEFELQGCDITLNCQRTFNTYIYETSSVDSTERRNLVNYQQLERISPVTNDGSRVNTTITISFNTDRPSFYFAIQDETSCIGITRLMVFYDSQTGMYASCYITVYYCTCRDYVVTSSVCKYASFNIHKPANLT